MMYDIAKKVVKPATTSVDTVVPFFFSWKNFSIRTRFLSVILCCTL